MASTTPSNTYRYPPLLDFPDAIRLVVLLPATDKRVKIKCVLCNERLSNNPNYEALSYVWGDPHITKQIILNDTKFEATVNLEAALRCLRHPRDPRVMWIDALCIDQGNLTERTSQVQQMGAIYRHAKQVAVWLGPETNTSLRAFETLDKIATILREKRWESRSYDASPPWVNPDDFKAVDQKQAYRKFFLDFRWELGMEAIEKLFRRPWWQRVWVIQEIALAQEATLYCGCHYSQWDTFDEFLQMISKVSTEQVFYNNFDMTENWLEKVHNRLSGFLPGVMMSNIRHLRNNAHGNHLPELDLVDILNLCRGAMCTDPRDRVYGVLGIFTATASNHQLRRPDYTISVTQLYSAVASEKLLRDRTLDIFSMITPDHLELPEKKSNACFQRDYYLPSWTPDWGVLGHSSVQEAKIRPEGDKDTSQKLFCAALDRRSPIPFSLSSSGLVLTLHGVKVDIISEISSSKCTSRSAEAVDDWKIMAGASSEVMYAAGQSRAEAFWRTVLNDRWILLGDILANREERLKPGEFVMGILGGGSFPPKSTGDERHLKTLLCICPYHMASKSFFCTQQGYLGTSKYMGPSYPEVCVGDIVVVLLGGKVPYILRCDGTGYRLIASR